MAPVAIVIDQLFWNCELGGKLSMWMRVGKGYRGRPWNRFAIGFQLRVGHLLAPNTYQMGV